MILHGLPTGTLGADQERLMHQALDGGIATARRLASELRPPLLDDLGLEAALRHMLDGLLAGSAMHVRVALEDASLLDERQSIGVFRIVQEAASNVLRHAQATRFTIESRRTPTGWRLTISDDGAGFDPARVRRGALGLVGMRERAEMLDAQLSVDSTPGGGSRVSLELPVRTGAADRYA
jgi:signal transduction histidine kinase